MKNELKVFKNDKFGEIEILIKDGKEYFPAKEIAILLGYKDPLKAVNTHCKEKGWVIRPYLTKGGKQDKKYIDEGNLYRLIVKSELPQAEAFESWVFDEVLPLIRKTGSYSVNQKQPTESQKKRLEIMERNSKVREANMWYKLLGQAKTEKYKEVILSYTTKALNGGKEVIPLPLMAQRTLTATELGNLIGVTGNKIGRLANKYNLKTDDYGYYVHDKAKHSNKEIPNFVYFEHTIEKFRKLLEKEKQSN